MPSLIVATKTTNYRPKDAKRPAACTACDITWTKSRRQFIGGAFPRSPARWRDLGVRQVCYARQFFGTSPNDYQSSWASQFFGMVSIGCDPNPPFLPLRESCSWYPCTYHDCSFLQLCYWFHPYFVTLFKIISS